MVWLAGGAASGAGVCYLSTELEGCSASVHALRAPLASATLISCGHSCALGERPGAAALAPVVAERLRGARRWCA